MVHEQRDGPAWWGIAHGPDAFVAVGEHGNLIRSVDGARWQAVDSGTTDDLMAVVFGAGRFVAVGDRGRIIRSTDGLAWVPVPQSVTTRRLNGIALAGDRFVAVGEAGTIISSPDAESWTVHASNVTGWLRGVAYEPGTPNSPGRDGLQGTGGLPAHCVVCGAAGRVLTSAADGSFQPDPKLDQAWADDFEVVLASSAAATAFTHVAGIGGTLRGLARDYGWIFPKLPVTHPIPPTVALERWIHTPLPTPARMRALVQAADGALWAAGDEGEIVACATGQRFPLPSRARLMSGLAVGNGLYFVGEYATIVRIGPPPLDRLVNLSARAWIGPGENELVAGFVLTGTGRRRVLVRGIGPALARHGVADALPGTLLNVYDARQQPVCLGNVGWDYGLLPNERAERQRIMAECGAFALETGSRDSALILSLPSGSYTVHVSSTDGEHGTVLAEIYDLDPPNDIARPVNLSSLSRLDSHEATHINGFVLGGTGTRRLLLRAVGPGPVPWGVREPIASPTLALFRAGDISSAAVIPSGWSIQPGAEDTRAAAALTGAFPLTDGSADAAAVLALSPGVYSAVARNLDGQPGRVLVEIYELP